jgi:hypothetical protein
LKKSGVLNRNTLICYFYEKSLSWIKAAFNNNTTALWWPSWWESVTAGHTILEEDHPMTIPSKLGSN